MRIQKLLKIGIVAGLLAYGIKACDDYSAKTAKDLVRARDNAKTLLKKYAPQKYDSLTNLCTGSPEKSKDIKVWLDAEVNVLESLNNQATYNKALHNIKSAAGDSLKHIR